jgi:hypothetical protein
MYRTPNKKHFTGFDTNVYHPFLVLITNCILVWYVYV